MLAVFNGICGTKVNTRHTVCAAFAPNRLAVLKLNVVQHTASYAFSASYAFVGGVEFVCGYDEFVKDRIYYAAFQSVRNADLNIGERLFGFDVFCCVKSRFIRFYYKLLRGFFIRCAVKSRVIFGHYNLVNTHKFETLVRAKRL